MRWSGVARCAWRGAVWVPDFARLAVAARALLPAGCAVAATDPRLTRPLMPGEALPDAIARRLAEFSAGRHAARLALGELGIPPLAIPQGPDRAPLWPRGIAGTITHSASACLAAVVREPAGIGLDLEADTALAEDLWPEVLLGPERAWVLDQPDPGWAAMLVFSAKEAAYKAQYATSRRLFGFDGLMIAVADDRFTATFCHDAGPFAAGFTLHGRHARLEGHVLTAVSL